MLAAPRWLCLQAEGGYMFVFSSFPDRDKCRDIYGMILVKLSLGEQKLASQVLGP